MTWTWVGSDTIPMAAGVLVGVGGSSVNATHTSTSTYSNVTVTPGTPTAPAAPPAPSVLPSGWSHQDVGAVGFTGDASYDSASATFSVKGAGADVWGVADGFHFVSRPMSGDGYILARVRTLQNTSASAKAGVMIRETLTDSAPNAFMFVTPSKGTAFQQREATGRVDADPRRRRQQAAVLGEARTGRQHLQRLSVAGRHHPGCWSAATRSRWPPPSTSGWPRAATARWRPRPRSSTTSTAPASQGRAPPPRRHLHRRRRRCRTDGATRTSARSVRPAPPATTRGRRRSASRARAPTCGAPPTRCTMPTDR